jgi:hypothetical protein
VGQKIITFALTRVLVTADYAGFNPLNDMIADESPSFLDSLSLFVMEECSCENLI